jgi:ribokinase
MTDPDRPPRSAERAEGDPPDEEPGDGRTPHSGDPAEGQDLPDEGAGPS